MDLRSALRAKQAGASFQSSPSLAAAGLLPQGAWARAPQPVGPGRLADDGPLIRAIAAAGYPQAAAFFAQHGIPLAPAHAGFALAAWAVADACDDTFLDPMLGWRSYRAPRRLRRPAEG